VDLGVEVIEGILQHSWDTVVVLCGDEDVSVEAGDLLFPAQCRLVLRWRIRSCSVWCSSGFLKSSLCHQMPRA
jgi:hypothetical protein